jgi:hypothetical protein
VRIYPGADGNFAFYTDDGDTYACEHGDYRLTQLHWDKVHKLTFTGAEGWDPGRTDFIETVGRAGQ